MTKRAYKRSEVRGDKKKCSRCETWKPLTEFYRKGDGHVSQCKECQRGITRNWIANNKERDYETKRRKSLMDNYGITLEQYDDMLEDQEGVCAICLEPETRRHSSGTPFSLAVDHCHTTGRVRGLLCQTCNRAIGLLKDRADLLRAAALYVERGDDL